MNLTTTSEVTLLDPQVVIRKAKEIEGISHAPARKFYAKILQTDVQRAIAYNHSRTVQAVHDGERYAFELGRIAESLESIVQSSDDVER